MLRITDDIDKNAYGRDLPLSRLAREALDFAMFQQGVIFGKYDFRFPLRDAARKILPSPECDLFTPYDFRRCALTRFGDKGGLKSIAYMAGHRQLTTSSIYIRANMKAARKMLDDLEGADLAKIAVGMASPEDIQTQTEEPRPAVTQKPSPASRRA